MPALRMPRVEDGPRVSRLIAQCPPLSTNSAYCNLLQCTHFADTCILAEQDGRIVGWIGAYRPPTAREQLFVWQIAVHESARGTGLGGRMLDALVRRPSAEGTILLTATIADANSASWALFTSFARRHDAQIARRPIFDRDVHFAGADASEYLVSIGPLARRFQAPTGG